MTEHKGLGKLTIDESKLTVLRGPSWTRTEQTRGEGANRQRLFTADGDMEVWDPDPEQETTIG